MRVTGFGGRVLAAIVLMVFSAASHSQNEFQLLVHPKAAALGNAVTADPPGIMAIRRNPAGLTRLEGRQFEVSQVVARTVFEAEFTVPDDGCDIFGIECAENDPAANSKSKTSAPALFIPKLGLAEPPTELPVAVLPMHGAISVNRPGSKLTFANGAWLEQVGGAQKDSNDPGRYQGKTFALQRLTYFAPTVAYKINDDWSVGAGINFSHHGLGASQQIRAPNLLLGVGATLQDAFGCDEQRQEPLAPFLALCGGKIGPFQDIGSVTIEAEDSLSTSYRMGVLWEPNDWFSWGAQYSSGDTMNLEGEAVLDFTDEWARFWQSVNSSVLGAIGASILSLPSGVPREEANVKIRETHPQQFSTGISAQVAPWVTINADLDWVDFNDQRFVDIQFDRQLEFLNAARILSPEQVTPTSLRLKRGREDVWSLGYGAEFHVSTRLDLRAGVQHRTNATKREENLLVPIWGANLYGVGAGYRWSKDTQVDVNFSFIQTDKSIPADGSCSINCNNITNIADNPFAGLDVNAETNVQYLGIAFRSKF